MELIHPLFKWLHIIAGVAWIGLLYFFNWTCGQGLGHEDRVWDLSQGVGCVVRVLGL